MAILLNNMSVRDSLQAEMGGGLLSHCWPTANLELCSPVGRPRKKGGEESIIAELTDTKQSMFIVILYRFRFYSDISLALLGVTKPLLAN
ncbi:hypothetical protein PROFUN_14780 [Planoprotostelium fungivorum]|uniref:Uncharacterized protein n=1 Tax=Planoprotostelium fungivorum TaxID=1890364 RepID=A0A2P6MYI2_9EUKA|nr:hypothetical protein PROFUN_14780 [Planoprotostelium fungivorum]